MGHVNSPWGLAGHVKITPQTSNPKRFIVGAEMSVDGVSRRVEAIITPRGYPVIRFSGITGREQAETLRGAAIEIEVEALPLLPEGSHYIHDVLGLTVATTIGEHIGEIVDILTTGANDVYVVRREGQQDALIPATAEVVIEIDLNNRRLVINPLTGLLDR